VTPLLLVVGLAFLPGNVRGEGDETIGPLKSGFLVDADCVVAYGTGLHAKQPGLISFDYPKSTTVRQVILYWGHRADKRDDNVKVNDTTVTGELIGTSPGFPDPDSIPFVFRADVTRLNLVVQGHNEISISGLVSNDLGEVDGAELVILGDDGRKSSIELRDGADFAYWKFTAPHKDTVRQRLSYSPSDSPREAQLTLVIADHLKVDGGRMRRARSRSEGPGAAQVLNDPRRPPTETAGTRSLSAHASPHSTPVEAQVYSETRTGNKQSPSSFYWPRVAQGARLEPAWWRHRSRGPGSLSTRTATRPTRGRYPASSSR
jgi:hypothetical protein